MTKTEKEALTKILVALFLESPRRRTELSQQGSQEETLKKTSPNAHRTRKQQPGGEKHGR